MTREPLTRRQLELAQIIQELTKETGTSPSFQQLAKEMDLSTGNISALVKRMTKKGWLEPRRHRQQHGLILTEEVPMPDFSYLDKTIQPGEAVKSLINIAEDCIAQLRNLVGGTAAANDLRTKLKDVVGRQQA